MRPDLRRARRCLGRCGLVASAGLLLAGCASLNLDGARQQFYAGRFDSAERSLKGDSVPQKDAVLFYMERGTIRQGLGDYEGSARDFIAASDLIDEFETYSLSKGASSWVVNDTVQDYRGTPFERTLVHAFAAMSHLSLANWDNAAVEARRIVRSQSPGLLGSYPEDAYSRYLAGFCFEMIDDYGNASVQYRLAARLAPAVGIDERSGRLTGPTTTTVAQAQSGISLLPEYGGDGSHELVCFVLSGRGPSGGQVWGESWKAGAPAYAEIYCRGERLGRSYALADTMALAFTTEQLEAVRKAAKAVGRVVLKEVIAGAIEHETNDAMGELARFILIGLLERPDVRRWETLPRWLQVARVPCPPDLKEFEVVFKNAYGGVLREVHVTQPITRRRTTFVSICRDLPPAK